MSILYILLQKRLILKKGIINDLKGVSWASFSGAFCSALRGRRVMQSYSFYCDDIDGGLYEGIHRMWRAIAIGL